MPQTPERLHTVEQFRERVPIGRWKFYDLVREGRLRTVKIGSRTFIADTELRRYLASLEETR